MNFDEFRDLKFSCEIDFTRLTRSESAEKVAAFFGTESVNLDGDTYGVQDNSDRTWRLEKDDSIKPEKLDSEGNRILASEKFQCKLVSPFLNYSEITLVQELVNMLVSIGIISNSSCVFRCGVKANFNVRHITYICSMIYEKQTLLEKALNTYEKRRTRCKYIPDTVMEAINKRKPRTFQDFALIWFTDGDGIASDRVLDLANMGEQEIKFQLFNGVLEQNDLKSLIEFSLLLTLKALNRNRATYKSPQNYLCEKERMLKFLFDDLGTKPGDDFIDMRILLLKLLPSKLDMDEYCSDVDGPLEDDEEDCKPPLFPSPNTEVPDGAFEPISDDEWKKYCEGID